MRLITGEVDIIPDFGLKRLLRFWIVEKILTANFIDLVYLVAVYFRLPGSALKISHALFIISVVMRVKVGDGDP